MQYSILSVALAMKETVIYAYLLQVAFGKPGKNREYLFSLCVCVYFRSIFPTNKLTDQYVVKSLKCKLFKRVSCHLTGK